MRNNLGQWTKGHTGNAAGRPRKPAPFNLVDELRPELRQAAETIIRRRIQATQIAPGAAGLDADLFILRLALQEDVPGAQANPSATQLLRFLQSAQGWTLAMEAVIRGLSSGAYSFQQISELQEALSHEPKAAASSQAS